MTSTKLILVSCVYSCLLSFHNVNKLLFHFIMYFSVKIDQPKCNSKRGPLTFSREKKVHVLEKVVKQCSQLCTVDIGVHQGTVLCHLLFLCHVSDVPQRFTSKVTIFADDCLLYRTILRQVINYYSNKTL